MKNKNMKINCWKLEDGNEVPMPSTATLDGFEWNGKFRITVSDDDGSLGLPFLFAANDTAIMTVETSEQKGTHTGNKKIKQILRCVPRSLDYEITCCRIRSHNGKEHVWSAWETMSSAGGIKVDWDASSCVDTFITAGIYNISGERLNVKDGLPIANSNPGHTIKARLVVLDSSISGSGDTDDKCITQILTLSNRTGGDGDVYIRTGRASIKNQLAGGTGWEPWGKLQQNIEVGQVTSLNNFIGNGIYSGVYTNGSSFFETFVMVVINNYAVAGATGQVRSISQFKYALNVDSTFSYKTRTGRGGSDIEWGSWVDLGAADTTDIQDGAITAQKLSSDVRGILSNSHIGIYTNALNSQLGGNIFDKNAVDILVDKMFLDIFGNIKDQEKYNISDYMAVVPGQTYVVSSVAISPHGYDIYKRHTATIAVNSGVFTVPEGTYWIRVAYYQGWEDTFCVNKGTNVLPENHRTFGLIRTEKLYDNAVTTEKIANASVTMDKLSEDLKEKVKYLPVIKKSGAFMVKGELSSGETFSLPQNSVEVGEYITFSANIDGEFNALYVGHGKNEGAYMKITPTAVTAYSHASSPVAEQTFEHGLTIENNIQVYIEKKKNSTTDLRIVSNGKSYSFNYTSWYGNKGTPFAESEGCELKNCTLGWTCKGINSDIWAFGDSYFGVTGTIRWMAYLIAEKHTNLVVNAHGGQGSVSAFTELTNLLTIGTPKKILWCLGMNDTDSSTAVNSNWLNTYNSLKAVCEENNIELVLATIPTVPTRVNKFKNEIVRSSGYRYIDFDKAVGANETTGEWFSDMLSSDGVHPSETGALTLYNQAIADMPELLNY